MRSLVPYFFISTHPVGWKCSACGKIFRVPLNIMGEPTARPDDEVRDRFEGHSCLAYRDELQKRKDASAGANGGDDTESVPPTKA
jgi:hypothetical protein